MFLLVRSPRPAEALKPAVEGAVRSVDSDLVLSSNLTLDAVIGNSLGQPRFQTALLVVFSLLALILAMVGTYGVVSYSVARRTREIAVRVALGAQPSAIFSMVLKEGAGLGVAGIALGILGSLAAARVVSSLLFHTSVVDALTFSVVAVSLAAITLIACYLPARRAMRADPLVALRYE